MGRLQGGGTIASLVLVIISTCCRTTIAEPRGLFVYGDSYADTGNRNKADLFLNTPWRTPYGNRWPGKPAGRFSDGRILTDFVAGFLNLPSPEPYQGRKSRRSTSGVNFAYAGAGLFPTFGPDFVTIRDQIKQLKQLSYPTRFLSQSAALLVVAGNDYTIYNFNHPNDTSVAELFVADVVKEIGANVGRLYRLGFRNVAITLLEPFGCLPPTTRLNNYTSCNSSSNARSLLHNNLLLQKIGHLRRHFKDLNIVPLDLYSAFSSLLPTQSGGGRNKLRPCCEGKVLGASCGDYDDAGVPLFSLCEDPHKSFFWDSLHPSQRGWRLVTAKLKPSLRKLITKA